MHENNPTEQRYGYTNKTIVLHELIGLDVKVVNCSDRSQIGINGKVINETKNTLLVQTADGTKRIVKKNSVFEFSVQGRSFTVQGIEISSRPHERIEKSMRSYKKRQL